MPKRELTEPAGVCVVGIDPGLTGAIAALNNVGCWGLWDVPTKEASGGFVKRAVDADELSVVIDDILTKYPRAQFVLERAGSRPTQGVASSFSMGDTYGCIRGVIAAYGGNLTVVSPAMWKRDMGLSSDKDESMYLATVWFPGMKKDLSRKKDHNRAEALLLAVWKARELGLTIQE